MKHLLPILLSFIIISISVTAQVTTDPEFPLESAAVTVYFHAEGTPLEGYTGDLYTHTGVIIQGETDWSHVIGDWGNNTNQPKLTRISTNEYSLEVTPDIRTFYDVDADEIVSKMAFVFRADAGSPQSSDLFVDVFSNELSVVILEPFDETVLVPITESLVVKAVSLDADRMELYLDNELVFENTGGSIEYTLNVPAFGVAWQVYDVVVKSFVGTEEAMDEFSFTVVPEVSIVEIPTEYVDGINYLSESSVALVLYAPEKDYVFVVGDFNNYAPAENGYMNRTPDGERYWIQIDGLVPGQEYGYQYEVNGDFRIADPYTELVLDSYNDPYISDETFPDLKPYPTDLTDGIVSVLQTNQQPYSWVVTDFQPPLPKDLVVYELLIRDFSTDGNLMGVIENFDYLKDMGINAIELMPVNEFEGNLSWGYNPSFYFAFDKYYGTKNKLKEFIDLCHQNDIAVILDMVLNHQFGQSPLVRLYWDDDANIPAANNPWFNQYATHPYNVGYDMNHESPQTKAFSKRVMKFWLDEYKVDGYRFDLSKGFTQVNSGTNVDLWGQYDATRIAIWNDYEQFIHSVSEDAYVILEHFADNTEEKVLSANNMMLWGNMNYNYNEASMGWLNSGSTFDWIDYQERGWSDPHVVGYMESHDEERLMYKNVTYGNTSNPQYNIQDTTIALQRIELAATFFIPISGPKMVWMFGEMGYDYTIDYNGRTGEKPVRWDYFSDYRRKFLYDTYSALINLKMDYKDVFNNDDYNLDVSGDMRSIKITNETLDVMIVGNFGVDEESDNFNFENAGWWYDYLSGDSINVVTVTDQITLQPGEYHLYTSERLTSPGLNSALEEVFVNANQSVAISVYPNPVTELITFDIALNAKADCVVFLTDSAGRRVAELVQDELPAGIHSLSYNSKDLGLDAGLYFITIVANNSQVTKKFILK